MLPLVSGSGGVRKVTLKKQYPKPKEEIKTRVRHRKEEQKQLEADQEIREYEKRNGGHRDPRKQERE
jgi:hypothetical protein